MVGLGAHSRQLPRTWRKWREWIFGGCRRRVCGGSAPEVTPRRDNGRTRPKGYADWRPRAETRALLDQVLAILVEGRDRVDLLRTLPVGAPS